MKGHLDVKKLESMKKADLQELAKNLGVSAEGTIKEIAARCAEVEVEVPEENELTEEEKKAQEQAAKEAAEKEAQEQAVKEKEKTTGLVTVKAKEAFLDKKLNQIKNAGEEYKVNKERAAELVKAKVAEIVE